jgi:glucosamine-6-phosphate deaminase
MWNSFFKHVDIDPANAHILDGNASDLVAECDAFEAKIVAVGGIELFLAGKLTTTLHLLFNAVSIVLSRYHDISALHRTSYIHLPRQASGLMVTLPSMSPDRRWSAVLESRRWRTILL